jgi:hypothetical protein
MITRTSLSILTLIAGLGVATLRAQHQEHQAPASQTKGKMGGAMMGDMAGHMAEMMGGHRQVAALVDKLALSFAAIQAERDPAALAKKMAEHEVMLKELQAKVKAHSAMMEKMEKEETTPAPAAAHQH